jgi:hypothetical protein
MLVSEGRTSAIIGDIAGDIAGDIVDNPVLYYWAGGFLTLAGRLLTVHLLAAHLASRGC